MIDQFRIFYLKKKKKLFFQIVTNVVVPENIVHTLKELTETLKSALQIKELNELINSVFDYVEAVSFDDVLTREQSINRFSSFKFFFKKKKKTIETPKETSR